MEKTYENLFERMLKQYFGLSQVGLKRLKPCFLGWDQVLKEELDQKVHSLVQIDI